VQDSRSGHQPSTIGSRPAFSVGRLFSLQSQRDCALQPGVARNELPWVFPHPCHPRNPWLTRPCLFSRFSRLNLPVSAVSLSRFPLFIRPRPMNRKTHQLPIPSKILNLKFPILSPPVCSAIATPDSPRFRFHFMPSRILTSNSYSAARVRSSGNSGEASPGADAPSQTTSIASRQNQNNDARAAAKSRPTDHRSRSTFPLRLDRGEGRERCRRLVPLNLFPAPDCRSLALLPAIPRKPQPPQNPNHRPTTFPLRLVRGEGRERCRCLVPLDLQPASDCKSPSTPHVAAWYEPLMGKNAAPAHTHFSSISDGSRVATLRW